ncbi:MAG: hypothetical protein FWF02_01215 [Micrococcales bacterium]|nr:hypothetical protein [Micrococcales bacterium]MCL2666315.1 hypothetical protein [Micrococcales bacterium]
MTSNGQNQEAVAGARAALATKEPPAPDVVEAVADALQTVPAPLLMVPHPRTVHAPGTPIRVRRRP